MSIKGNIKTVLQNQKGEWQTRKLLEWNNYS